MNDTTARETTLGARLVALREARGWTVGEAASKTGIPRGVLAWIEDGWARPLPFEREALARVYGFASVDALLKGEGGQER